MTITQIDIIQPDDMHVHLRDGDALNTVVPHTARQFARAMVMPNLRPPVTTADMAAAYQARIMAAIPDGIDFAPLMTLYLTDRTSTDDVKAAF